MHLLIIAGLVAWWDPQPAPDQNESNAINHKEMKGMQSMKKSLLLTVGLAALLAGLSSAYAQTPSTDFKTEPDKTMAAAHESFVKGDTKAAAADIAKASDYVKKQSVNMADDSKDGMKGAGDELAKLGDGVKDGTVKSGDDLKKTFAKVDHEMASCWHKTAEDSRKAGKDSTAALKKSGNALQNSAKWSGNQVSAGAKASMKAMKKAGKATGEGAKAGADEVDKWSKGIGDGIADLGKKL